MRIVSQTVRCEGVDADARHGTGKADVSVPALLQKRFPQLGPYLGVYAQVVGAGGMVPRAPCAGRRPGGR